MSALRREMIGDDVGPEAGWFGWVEEYNFASKNY